MLAHLVEARVTEIFDERFIFFPEIDDEAREIASQHGFSCNGSAANLGIFGGFRALASEMTSDTILLLENDLRMIEPPEEAARQLRAAFDVVESETVQVVFLRHCKQPGDDFATRDKYRRFFPADDAGLLKRVGGKALQLARPDKRARLIGTAPYAEEAPEELFVEVERHPESGFWLVPTNNKAWTNQSFVIRRDFFLNTLLDYVGRARTTRRVNGFKNIEIELNSRWWRDKPWKVAIAPGLFTHQREGDRGY